MLTALHMLRQTSACAWTQIDRAAQGEASDLQEVFLCYTSSETCACAGSATRAHC